MHHAFPTRRSSELNEGTPKKVGVQMIGADADAIDKAENRQRFREAMDRIGLESARSGVATTVEQAFAVLETPGLPAIIRPSFTLGGTGGGIAYNKAEFERIVREGRDASPPNGVLIEASMLGRREERGLGKACVSTCRAQWSP